MDLTLPEFRVLVEERLTQSIDSLTWLVQEEFDQVPHEEFLAPARLLLSSGKRTRAAFVLAGYQLATTSACDPAATAGSAIELYQASALVHDDVIDDSPTRRGNPAAHVAFTNLHTEGRWLYSPADFGRASAIVLGDLLLSEASKEFQAAAAMVAPREGATAFRQFQSMCTEVAFGQYLDIRAEQQPLDRSQDAIASALSVLRHKSANYSVQLPLVIGAHLGGGSDELISQLRKLGGLLGEAFQMRDDDLGIFGEPSQTGKPSGGDITEGKRTILLALIREKAGARRDWLDSRLGTVLSDADISQLRTLAISCGARSEHEDMILAREDEARLLLQTLDGNDDGIQTLANLMHELAGRTA